MNPFRNTRYHLLIHNIMVINCCAARREKLFEEYGHDAEEVGYVENGIVPSLCHACGLEPCLKE